MPKREILFCGDPVLRKKAQPVTRITDEIRQLFEDMTISMTEAPGVGLAAPQVGEPIRAICVREDVDDESEIHCLINPRIVDGDGIQEGVEGCLSVPTVQGIVIRQMTVVAEGTNVEGRTVKLEAEGLMARALQHEIDHLDGVLFIDRAQPDTLGWMVPDEDEESGYRIEDSSLEEVAERFEKLYRSKHPR